MKTKNKEAPDKNSLSYKVLTLDLQKYLEQLKDWDLSETQKQEIIHALWAMLRPFAELGFEIHPAQLAQKTRKDSTGNSLKTKGKPTIEADFVVSSSHTQSTDNQGGMR